MTDREAQIEALWTYEISTEKILRRAVKKGFISQSEADEFSEKLFEQLDTKRIPGFLPSPLREKMCAEDYCNSYLHHMLCNHHIFTDKGAKKQEYIPQD